MLIAIEFLKLGADLIQMFRLGNEKLPNWVLFRTFLDIVGESEMGAKKKSTQETPR